MNARTNRAMLAIAMVAVMALSCFVVVGTSADSDASGSERGYVKIKVGGEYVEVFGSEEFVSMKAALSHINNTLNEDDESAGIVVECQAGKAIDFVGAHQCVVKRSITIEGNGAYGYFDNPDYESSKGGEVDFCIEQYDGTNGDPDNRFDHDVHLTINDLHNFGVWGTRLTVYTFNLELNDCTSSPADYQNQMRIYINGTTGYNNITLNGCKFYENSSNCTVYSNANGTINVNDCIFDGVSEPININSKSANVDVKINVNRCSFNNSGIAKTDGADKTWAAPIRVVNSTDANGSSIVSVDSCKFTYDEGKAPDNGDVLIGDGRLGQGSNDVKLTVRNTTADVQFQEPGYYTDDPSNPTDGSKIQSSVVRADQILESTGSDVTISDAPVDVPDTPDYDDEDDDYPFIPGQNVPQTSSGSDDRTTLVAAAAAVVVIMLAVVALMVTRNH